MPESGGGAFVSADPRLAQLGAKMQEISDGILKNISTAADYNEQKTALLLKFHEGLRLKWYFDTEGVPTWGYGRNLRDNPPNLQELQYLLDHGATEATASEWFRRDITSALTDVLRFLGPEWDACDVVRRTVLVDMMFNLGATKLLKFKNTRRFIRNGNRKLAATGMLASLWATQVKTRAVRLSRMMATGNWPTDVPGLSAIPD